MRDIPLQRFDGIVPSPIASYRPANGRIPAGFESFVGIAFRVAVAAGGPNVPQTEANPAGGTIPFRRSTTGRVSQLPATGPVAMTANQQQVQQVVDGSGYIYGVDIDVQGATSANVANVVYTEDAPWNALGTVNFGDVNGSLIDLDGFSLYLANKYGGWTFRDRTVSTDTNIYQLQAGNGANGGSFRFHLFAPIALNRRSLLALVANQDRAQKYSLRDDINTLAAVYGTQPTSAPQVTIRRHYDNYSVPATQNANGAAQQQQPPKFGVLHYLTQSVNPTAPAAGAQNHYLPRLGNTIRLIILVLRSNSLRSTAESTPPTQIQFLLGDTPVFVEAPAYRRTLMYDRYGFDAPAGVYVYDFITDILLQAGGEMGEDYAYTNGLVNAQFVITYPAGWNATGSSLTVITDDLVIPANVDIYAPDA